MQLFKMLGQVFELDNTQNTALIKNNTINKSHQEGLDEKSIGKEQKSPTGNHYVKKTYNDKKPQTSNGYNKQSFYCLFSPDGQSLLVLDNKEQVKIKLLDIHHPDKYQEQAKKASNLLNDLAKKKKVYYEVFDINGTKEYKIYLDDKKEKCLNDFLIESGLSSSVKLNPLKNDNKEQIKEQYTPAKVVNKTNDNQGILMRFGSEPYLFDQNNSLSYFVELKNENKSTVFWGVDLERVILEDKISQGDEISVKNLGPQMVTIEVPIKDKFGNITGHQEKTVKRNTWEATVINKLIEKQVVQEKIEPVQSVKEVEKIVNTSQNSSSKDDNRKNCYALFATGANSFIGMYQDKRHEFTLDNINLEIFSDKQQEIIETKLDNIITKKVVYIEFKGNNIVKLYKDKTSFMSINQELLNLKFEPDPIENTTSSIKTNESVVEQNSTTDLTQFKKIATENKNIEKVIKNSNDYLQKSYPVEDDPFSDEFYSDDQIVSKKEDTVQKVIENINSHIHEDSNVPTQIDNFSPMDIPEYFDNSSPDYLDNGIPDIPFDIESMPPMDMEGMNLSDLPLDDNDFFDTFSEINSSPVEVIEPVVESSVLVVTNTNVVEEEVEIVKPKKLAFGKKR